MDGRGWKKSDRRSNKLLLYCYHYDPLSGKYNLLILRVMRLAGLATVALLASAFVLILLWRERRRVPQINGGHAA